jgi:hypothetical protein
VRVSALIAASASSPPIFAMTSAGFTFMTTE